MEPLKDIDGRDQNKVDEEIKRLQEYLNSLGVEKLSQEISDERFARRILESKNWIDSYNFSTAIEEKIQDSIEQRFISVQTQAFDKAISYNNFVVTFGYAGFFAIWTFTKDQLHIWDTSLVAVLLGFSLLLFILWTVSMTMISSRRIRKMGLLLNNDFDNREAKLEAILELEMDQNNSSLRIWAMWMPCFIVTIMSGLIAGLILLTLLICQVLGVDFSFFELKEWILQSKE